MGLNYKSLLEHYQHDAQEANSWLGSALKKKAIRPADFDLGRLFCECFGWHEFQECRDNGKLASHVFSQSLTEAAGAVASYAFQTITANIISQTVIDAYEAPEFVFTKQIPVRPTKLRTERIPGISGLGDERQVVGETEAYPIAGVSEEWQDTPIVRKYGFQVHVSREAVFFDQSGILVDRVGKVAYWDAYAHELQAIDCVIDENAGASSGQLGGHRYNYKGNSIASYGNSSGNHNWDNLQATNALVDYTDVENAELLFDAMTDVTTGVVTGAFRLAANQIIVPTSLLHTAKQILSATEIRLHAGGYATSGNLYDRVSPSSLQAYQIVTSPLLTVRLATDTSWFVGNIGKACEYIEAWPQETKQAPSNDKDEFERDIVMKFRTSRMGAFHVRQPRYLVTCTVA